MNIGLGTAAIGRPLYINIREKQDNGVFDKAKFIEKGKQLLSQAYQKGIRHFDTAPGYGIAEQILIEWIAETNPSGISVSTKWGYSYVADFDPNAKVHEIKEHSLNNLNTQWSYSSKLLPYLTIYQIHSATLESGVLDNEDVLNRLLELKEKHNIEIGLSSSGVNQNEIIEKALATLVNGKELFDSFQITYNVFDQSLSQISTKLKNKKIIIKEALANGRIFKNNKYPHYQNHYKLLEALAFKYQVGLDAIALRFCEDSIKPYSTLSGVNEVEHLKTNVQALTFTLSEKELNEIKELSVKPEDYWQERKQLEWN